MIKAHNDILEAIAKWDGQEMNLSILIEDLNYNDLNQIRYSIAKKIFPQYDVKAIISAKRCEI